MNDFSRNFEQTVAQGTKRHPLTGLRQAQPLEPAKQVPRQLRDQQPRPVCVIFLARHLLKPEIVLVLFNPVLHPATLERPSHQLLWRAAMVVGYHDVIAPTLNSFFVFDPSTLDHIAVWRAKVGRIPHLGHLLAVAITLPTCFRQRGDLLHQRLCLIGGDCTKDRFWVVLLTKLDQIPEVKLAVSAQGQRPPLRGLRHRLLEKPERYGRGAAVSRQQMRLEHFPFFSPKGEDRVVADLPLVVHPRSLFAPRALLIERSVKIYRHSITLLKWAHLPASLTQRAIEIMHSTDREFPQELSSRRWRHDRLDAEQFRQSWITAQDIEVEQTIATQDRIPTQAQDVFRFRIPALAGFDKNIGIDQLRDPEFADEVAHQDDAGVRRQRHIAENDIELIGFTSYIRIHSTGDSFRIKWDSVFTLILCAFGVTCCCFQRTLSVDSGFSPRTSHQRGLKSAPLIANLTSLA